MDVLADVAGGLVCIFFVSKLTADTLGHPLPHPPGELLEPFRLSPSSWDFVWLCHQVNCATREYPLGDSPDVIRVFRGGKWLWFYPSTEKVERQIPMQRASTPHARLIERHQQRFFLRYIHVMPH